MIESLPLDSRVVSYMPLPLSYANVVRVPPRSPNGASPNELLYRIEVERRKNGDRPTRFSVDGIRGREQLEKELRKQLADGVVPICRPGKLDEMLTKEDLESLKDFDFIVYSINPSEL